LANTFILASSNNEQPRIVNDGGWTTIYCDNIEAFSEWLGY